MATSSPNKNKDGRVTSYTIRVYHGSDRNGVRLKPFTKTWKPNPGMNAKQIKNELKRQEVEFKDKCRLGFVPDNKQTFEEYADYILKLKQECGTKRRTIERYKDFLSA